jgi:hypothetical protein
MSNIPSQESPLTVADLNAVIQVTTGQVKLLEQINNNLSPLKDIQETCADADSYIKQKLVTDIGSSLRNVIIEKQLDITNAQSTLAVSIAEQTTLLKSIFDKLTKAIWVLVLCVVLLGGVSVINNWFLNPRPATPINTPLYYFDDVGHGYIMSRAGDTLWVSPTKPIK